MTEQDPYTAPPGVLSPGMLPSAAPMPPGYTPPPASPTLPAGGLATAAIALTGAYAALGLVAALIAPHTVSMVKDAFDNPDSARVDFGTFAVGLITNLVAITSFIFLALWMARVRSNRTLLGETPGGPPAVEWWGWFIALANFVLPLLGMRAITRRLVGWGLLLAWWIPFCLFWLSQTVVGTAQFRAIDLSAGELKNPDALDQLIPFSWASAVLLAASWVFLVLVIRRTTARHTAMGLPDAVAA
jgi:hypothetical protein